MTRRLPPARTRLLGRERERAALRSSLADGEARLVTLLGGPGAGKSRLALEVARERESVACVWHCDLSAARTSADAALALADALEVELPERSDEKTAAAALTRALGVEGAQLVVLDNLERTLPEARALVEACLDAGAHVTVLATSRERVDVAGERCVTLPPLDEDDAAALFVERARAAGVDLPDDGDGVVRDLVRRLDRVPLAIELAAARVRVLPPQRLLERLEERLSILRGGHADLPALEEAIRLSWDRLSPLEQRALARASVFAGGLSLDGAEAVLRETGSSGQDVVDVLQALVDRSLLTSTATREGDVRFRLLENVRAFAAARLAELDLEEDTCERLATWLAAECERRVPPLRVSPPASALSWLQAERDNLLAVVRRPPAAMSGRRAAVKAALGLHQHLRERGPVAVDVEVLARVEALTESLAPDVATDATLSLRAAVATAIARRDERGWEATLAELTTLSTRARAAGLRGVQAEADAAAGEMLFLQGQHASAVERLEAALAVYVDESAREGAAQVKTLLGPALISAGRAGDAERVLLEAAADGDDLDLPRVAARAQYRLGILAHQRGALEAASSRYEAALERLGGRGSDLTLEAGLKHKLGVVHHERDELDAARALFEEAAGLYETVGSAFYVGVTLASLAAARADLGHLDDAAGIARRAEARLRAPGPSTVGFAAAWVGAIECRRGDHGAARAAFARAHVGLDERGDAYDRALLEILEGHLAVVDGEAAVDDVLERARAKAELGVSPRYALRFLERSLRGTRDPESAPRDGRPLVVAPDARWFQVGDGPRVDVARKRVLRRLLAALVERRVGAPGEVVTRAQMLGAGWPGERMRADSALSRLYVSVASLRRLGLEDVLLTAGDGYLLSPDVPIRQPAAAPGRGGAS